MASKGTAESSQTINFKNGTSMRITHPALCELLELSYRSPSNARDKLLRAFVDETFVMTNSALESLDETHFIVTVAAVCDQAYERMVNDFELGRALTVVFVFALTRCNPSTVSPLYSAGLARLAEFISDILISYQGEKRAFETLKPLQNSLPAWRQLAQLLSSKSQLFTHALITLFAQMFDLTAVSLCEESWTLLLNPFIEAVSRLDLQTLQTEAKSPDTTKVRIFRDDEFKGDFSVIPSMTIHSAVKMVCSTSNINLLNVIMQQSAVVAHLIKYAAKSAWPDVQSSRFATECLALLFFRSQESEKRVDAILSLAPELVDRCFDVVHKAISADQAWREAVNANDLDRQSFHILLLDCLSCLHSISYSAKHSILLLKTPAGQTEALLATLMKAWARFVTKAQVRGFEKHSWARLRHSVLESHATLSCDFSKKSHPICLIPFYNTMLISMQKRLLSNAPTDAVLAEATRLKEKGNFYFEKKSFFWAVEFYTAGLELLGEDDPALKVVLLSNRAQAHLEMKQASIALQDAEVALGVQPDHAKSLDRKKMAQEMLDKKVQQLTTYEDATGSLSISLVKLPLFSH